MGVRIIVGENLQCAVLYCSVTDWAFGPLFADYEEAESFLKWLSDTDGRDARRLTDKEMENAVYVFRTSCVKCEYCGRRVPLATHYAEQHWCDAEEKALLGED